MLGSLLRKGLLHLLSANFLIQFLGFGTLLLIPKFVSPEILGEIKVLQTYTDLLLLVALFGFNTSVLKLCSEPRPEAEHRYFLKVALGRMMLTTGVAYALLVGLSATGVMAAAPHLAGWLPVYGLVLPFSAVTMLLAAYLQARKRIREMARAQVVVKVQSVAAVVLATWQFGFRGFLVATVLAYAVGLWPFFRQVGTRFLREARRPVPGLFMNMAVYSTLANGVYRLGKRADLYILSLFLLDGPALGYYALATIFLTGAGVVTSTIQTLVLPYLSERSHDEGWFRTMLWRTQFQTALVSVAVALAVRLAAWVVVTGFYDPAYAEALRFLDVLLVFHVVRSSYAVIGTALISLGLPRYNFYSACLTTPVGLLLSFLALRHFGVMGVAWAQVLTGLVTLASHVAVAHLALRRTFARPAPAF